MVIRLINNKFSVNTIISYGCFVSIESEIPFYIDGEFFSSLSQFTKIQLKKIKNKCEQMGCITAEE